MSRRLYRRVTEPNLYFATTTFRDWKPLMALPEVRNAVEDHLLSLVQTNANALMGYVLMPTHIHLLIGCTQGGNQFSEFMRSFKSLTSRRLFADHQSVWVKRFDDFIVTTEKQFVIKLDYIHMNPVRAGLVKEPAEWKWSSAGFWMGDEPHPVLTKSWEWLSREGT